MGSSWCSAGNGTLNPSTTDTVCNWLLPSIDLQTYLVLVAAAMALILTPGPDTVFVLTQGVATGKRGGLRWASGTVLVALGAVLALEER